MNDIITLLNKQQITESQWLALRRQLWPGSSDASHLSEIRDIHASAGLSAFFFCLNGEPVAFAEAAIRTDYVNGCSASPVVFLEGIFCQPQIRRRGCATRLIAQVREWGIAHGCRELASDTGLDNTASQLLHLALGFRETERVVFYCQPLQTDGE